MDRTVAKRILLYFSGILILVGIILLAIMFGGLSIFMSFFPTVSGHVTSLGINPWLAKIIAIPVAVSVFPDEIYAAPKSWAQRAYPQLVHYNRLDKGGHFAAWEQPKAFSEELRTSFKALRG